MLFRVGRIIFIIINIYSNVKFLCVDIYPVIVYYSTHVILGVVSERYPRFCKCLSFSKSGFATFSDSAD